MRNCTPQSKIAAKAFATKQIDKLTLARLMEPLQAAFQLRIGHGFSAKHSCLGFKRVQLLAKADRNRQCDRLQSFSCDACRSTYDFKPPFRVNVVVEPDRNSSLKVSSILQHDPVGPADNASHFF